MPVPADSRLVTQGVLDRTAQANAGVFDGVVLIDVQITTRPNLDIESTVSREEGQHVIQKTDTRVDVRLAGAVEIEAYLDIGLVGLSLDESGSGHDA